MWFCRCGRSGGGLLRWCWTLWLSALLDQLLLFVVQVVTQLSFSFSYVSFCVLDHDCPSFVSSRDADLSSVDHHSKLFQCPAFISGQVVTLELWGTVSVCSALKDEREREAERMGNRGRERVERESWAVEREREDEEEEINIMC